MASASWATCIWFQRFSRAMILDSSPSDWAKVCGRSRDENKKSGMTRRRIGAGSLAIGTGALVWIRAYMEVGGFGVEDVGAVVKSTRAEGDWWLWWGKVGEEPASESGRYI